MLLSSRAIGNILYKEIAIIPENGSVVYICDWR